MYSIYANVAGARTYIEDTSSSGTNNWDVWKTPREPKYKSNWDVWKTK